MQGTPGAERLMNFKLLSQSFIYHATFPCTSKEPQTNDAILRLKSRRASAHERIRSLGHVHTGFCASDVDLDRPALEVSCPYMVEIILSRMF